MLSWISHRCGIIVKNDGKKIQGGGDSLIQETGNNYCIICAVNIFFTAQLKIVTYFQYIMAWCLLIIFILSLKLKGSKLFSLPERGKKLTMLGHFPSLGRVLKLTPPSPSLSILYMEYIGCLLTLSTLFSPIDMENSVLRVSKQPICHI